MSPYHGTVIYCPASMTEREVEIFLKIRFHCIDWGCNFSHKLNIWVAWPN